MMPISLGELASRLGGELVGLDPDTLVFRFALDSSEAGPGAIFLAIKGAKFDGHDFVDEALQNGAVTATVEREVDAPYVLVPNLVDALAKMASSFRDQFSVPVIGVTGSAGKTTTKEFLAAALSPLGRIGKTEGNRNTELTAPLLWAELVGDEAAVVVEMSMRGFDQIAHLARFSRPTMGIVTNIGSNHAEKVGSRDGVARAKAELLESLPTDGLAIVWREDEFFDFLVSRAPCPVAAFGWLEGCDAQIVEYRPLSWSESWARFRVDEKEVEIRIPAAGRHFALNAVAALLGAVRVGVSPVEAAKAMESATLPDMRMQAIQVGGATIVMDNYNAAPQSFVAALETLAELPAERRIVVAGEMRELGAESEAGHREAGEAISRANVDRAIFFGETMGIAAQAAMEAGLSHENIVIAQSLDDIRREMKSLRSGDVVLVKGSRALRLEDAFDGLIEAKEAASR